MHHIHLCIFTFLNKLYGHVHFLIKIFMWQYRGKIELISLAYVRTCNNRLTINVEKSIIIMYTYNSVKSKSVSFVRRDKLNHLMGDYAIFPIYIGNILKEKKYYCMYKCMNIRFCYWIIFKNSLFLHYLHLPVSFSNIQSNTFHQWLF